MGLAKMRFSARAIHSPRASVLICNAARPLSSSDGRSGHANLTCDSHFRSSSGGASAGKKQRRFGMRRHEGQTGGWNNMATASVAHEAGHSPYGYSLSMS